MTRAALVRAGLDGGAVARRRVRTVASHQSALGALVSSTSDRRRWWTVKYRSPLDPAVNRRRERRGEPHQRAGEQFDDAVFGSQLAVAGQDMDQDIEIRSVVRLAEQLTEFWH